VATKNSIDSNIPIEISKGGSNAITFVTNTGIIKYDGVNLVTSSTNLIDSSDEQTNSSQPAFSAYLAASDLNKTGAGAAYTLGTKALTEIFDQGGDFNVNGTFTSPVDGKYIFNSHNGVTNCTIANKITLTFQTSKRSYFNTFTRPSSAFTLNCFSQCIADMDAGDTAVSIVATFGEAGNTNDINATADFITGFSGYLLC
jgi:hypothetical protein